MIERHQWSWDINHTSALFPELLTQASFLSQQIIWVKKSTAFVTSWVCTKASKLTVPCILTDLVFLIVDKVPSLNEMLMEILNDRTFETDANVRPSHSRILSSVKFVILPVRHVLEVHNTRIVVVLASKNDAIDVSRVRVRNRMLVSIPAPIAEVKASHEGSMAVDQT